MKALEKILYSSLGAGIINIYRAITESGCDGFEYVIEQRQRLAAAKKVQKLFKKAKDQEELEKKLEELIEKKRKKIDLLEEKGEKYERIPFGGIICEMLSTGAYRKMEKASIEEEVMSDLLAMLKVDGKKYSPKKIIEDYKSEIKAEIKSGIQDWIGKY